MATSMTLIDENSCPCSKSELDLQYVPPTQIAIENTRYEKVYPTVSINQHAPIEFELIAGDDYLDLSQSYLFLKCHLTRNGNIFAKIDNTAKDEDVVFPTNGTMFSLFRDVEIFLNNQKISQNNSLYPYRCYFENLLNYDSEVANRWLKMSMFELETNGFDHLDKSIDDDTTNYENDSAQTRFQLTRYSKPFEMVGRIHHELFQQPKLLINGSELRLRFERHDSRFFLMAKLTTKNFNLVIDKAVFYLCKKRVSPSVQAEHQKLLLHKPIKYPMINVQMRSFTLGPNRNDLSEQNVYSGQLPRRVIIGFIDSERHGNNLEKNPYVFSHHDLSRVCLKVNGTPITYQEIEMDFTNENFYEAYTAFLKGCNRLFDDATNIVTPEMYASSFCLHIFNLSSDGEDTTSDIIREGKISLEAITRTSITEPITIMVYMEFSRVMEIDSNRHVSYLDEK